jgi:hypothetical protein
MGYRADQDRFVRQDKAARAVKKALALPSQGIKRRGSSSPPGTVVEALRNVPSVGAA